MITAAPTQAFQVDHQGSWYTRTQRLAMADDDDGPPDLELISDDEGQGDDEVRDTIVRTVL